LSPLAPGAYELVVAPAAVALAFAHARAALGTPRATIEIGALVAYGYALEWAGMRLFRAHDYGTAWRLAPGGVPIAVAAVWAAVIVSATAVAARRGLPTAARRAAAAAVVATSLDVLIEPVAVHAGLWRWTPPGAWLGVPIGNFVGWTVVVSAWVAGLERDRADAPLRQVAVRRAALAAAAIVALALVGTTWQALELETALPAAAGWAAGAALWCGTLVLVTRPTRLRHEPRTAGERLAAARGRAPEAVLLLLVAAFAWSAIALLE
jgi:uncharacterized membrane protein